MASPGNNSDNSYAPTDYAGHAINGITRYAEQIGDNFTKDEFGRAGKYLGVGTTAAKVLVAWAFGGYDAAIATAKAEGYSFVKGVAGAEVGAMIGAISGGPIGMGVGAFLGSAIGSNVTINASGDQFAGEKFAMSRRVSQGVTPESSV
ncbi:hypothetical protein [Rhizobium sp. PP-F2F-G48]|uniref:hypothetical protein n=1 Tax=Rhizobium sp. PP-F2F-G48 TaxID=2135651 RepID=UPI001046502D|nr:hypothetical protein [Rhizobium sp. PP-F2F-G48]